MDVLPDLLGASPAILTVKERIARLLDRQSGRGRMPPLLIQGETGSGKGLLARAIHRMGPRAQRAFVDVNCAAIPETLLEAELFGFERGAFTDARQAKPGLFQAAHGGTIFLDEVALLPEALQAKLLKVIEERSVRRLGSTRPEPIDVWLVTATNEDLVRATRERRFREDLYHRLAVITVTLPPLRERAEDVLLLAEHFLARACADYGLPAKTLAPDARRALLGYAWPGNVRELANVMERVALLAEARTVTAPMLALPETAPTPAAGPPAGGVVRLLDALGSAEREHLIEALDQTRWNITRAAARLGISRDTLRYRITKHELRPGGGHPARRPSRARRPAAPPPPAPPEAGERAAVRWERRRLTLLRATLASGEGGDPRLYPSRLLEAIVEKAQSFGGRLEERSPTGILAAFGLDPVEDATRRAAHAAMAILRAVQRLRSDEDPSGAVTLAIHVDECLVGQAGGVAQIDLDGKRTAWAVLDALMAAAEPDSIAVSETARPFLERDFGLEGAGQPAYRLRATASPGTGSRRRTAAFAGRRHELELLHGCLALALQGHGQTVGILGEAGIGKSRLIFEFRRALLDLRVSYLEGRCQSYGSAIPYLPILDILRQNFEIADLDSPPAIAAKVRHGLEALGMPPGEAAPYLLHLFGVPEGTEALAALSPGAIKARTFETLRQMGLNGAQHRPIVFVVEDLQWIDAMSEECMTSLMDGMVGAPALFLATYRPGYRPPWVGKSSVTQIALPPLSREHSRSVLFSIRESNPLPDPLARIILERAEGNAFFIEELARAVEEGGAGEALAIPSTIEAVLRARLDRLPEGPKRLLQTAAVLGRQVPRGLLRAVWESAEGALEPGTPGEGAGGGARVSPAHRDLTPHLEELTRLQFLYPAAGGPEPLYAFVHALTQEVAYESLAAAERRALHRAAGQALEAAHAGRLEEVYDRLGYHYSRAELAEPAIEYLTRLADRAAGSHAHTETLRLLGDALRHVEGLPAPVRDRRRLELVIRQAYSLIPQGRFQDVVELLVAHEPGLQRLDQPAIAGPYHLLLARSCLFLGEDARAVASAERAIAEATRAGDAGTLGRVHYMLAQRSSLSGNPRDGLEHGARAAALLERAGDRWWLGTTYWATAVNHALLGEFEPALEAAARAQALGEAVGDPQAQGSAMWAIGIVRASRGEWAAGIEACRRSLELAPDELNVAIAAGWLGYAHLEQGEAAEAMPPLTRAVELLARFRFPQLQGLFTVFLADAHRLAGAVERAGELAARGRMLAQTSSSPFGAACADRALGRLALAGGRLADADRHLDAAFHAFEAIGARFELGRTAVERARLACRRGDPQEGARALAVAQQLFAGLGVPAHVARTGALAAELGLGPPGPR
jgi:transcriptional regulator with AAA-type ATPase domain/tetratricopeptide (TPR) repeat protein